MCNLYSLTKGQAALRDWFRARHDRTGNLPLFPGIFPDQFAPIVRIGADGERELVMARCVGSHLDLRISNFAAGKPSNLGISTERILTLDGFSLLHERRSWLLRIGVQTLCAP
jgi:hypothetical protein